MSKNNKLNWQKKIPDNLLEGDLFDVFDEESLTVNRCFVQVDQWGFFLYYKSDDKMTQVIDLALTSDVRFKTYPKDKQLQSEMVNNGIYASNRRSFCVCHGQDFVTRYFVHFITQSEEVSLLWKKTLQELINNNRIRHIGPTTTLLKHYTRLKLQVIHEDKIPIKNVIHTFASGKSEKYITKFLNDLDFPTGKRQDIDANSFTFEKFMKLYRMICPMEGIKDYFNTLTHGTNKLFKSKIKKFLNESQRNQRLNEILHPFFTDKDVIELVNVYENNVKYKNEESFSLDGFINYIMSDENLVIFNDQINTYMEMDYPINDYFINSSHNTYLIGRQIGGRSSVEIYRQVLLAGCRCVELDCWDGSNDEPIITHGKAMCTDVLFKDVIVAIADSAFVTSDYPVILSFENHCSPKQQLKMAKYCEEIMGNLLNKEPLPNFPCEKGSSLPSPMDLKRKILIKNKKLNPELEKLYLENYMKSEVGDEANLRDEAFESLDMSVDEEETSYSSQVDTISNSIEVTTESSIDELNRMKLDEMEIPVDTKVVNDEEDLIMKNYKHTGATTTVHPYLSQFVNYFQPVKFQGFDISIEKDCKFIMSSFNETVGLNLYKNSAISFVNYNKKQNSRIYPKGSRVDSSNFMPQIFWNIGCQMVSLNFQTPDLGMQINRGKFEYNGNCGYLLKSGFMRRSDRIFDPFSEAPVDGVIAATCEVRVISGYFLSDKRIGTYVEVDMFGLPTDTIRKEHRTKIVPSNGLNPFYDEEDFVFRKIVLPELALIRIAAYEETGKMIGQRVLPLDGLKSGLRFVSLRTDGNFTLTLPMLLIHITVKTYVPKEFGNFVNALIDPGASAKPQILSNNANDTKISINTNHSKSDSRVSTEIEISKKGANDGIYQDTSDSAIHAEFKISFNELKQSKQYIKLTANQINENKNYLKNLDKAKENLKKKARKAVSSKKKKGFSSDSTFSEESNLTINDSHMKEMKNVIDRFSDEIQLVQHTHLINSQELLLKLMIIKQQEQMDELKKFHEKSEKDLKAQQTKKQMDELKNLNNDKTIKNKAERDRRQRELISIYTKKFIDERNRLKGRQRRYISLVTKKQETILKEYEDTCFQNIKVSERLIKESKIKLKIDQIYL